jgi:NitT/TauT family transport system permease protein
MVGDASVETPESRADRVLGPPSRPPSRAREMAGEVVFQTVNVGLFFALWQWLARAEVLSPRFFPAPTEVATALYDSAASGLLWTHLGSSARNFAIGMTLACATAIPFGLVLGTMRPMRALARPYVWAIASLPTVAMVPLVVLIFGFTDSAKIALIVVGAVFPIVINCMEGASSVDRELVAAARTCGAGRAQILGRVVLPFTVPCVVSGVNQGMTQGLIGLVVAEMFATRLGLGFLMIQSQASFNAPRLYGVMLILGAISLTFVHGMHLIERKAAPWRAHQM